MKQTNKSAKFGTSSRDNERVGSSTTHTTQTHTDRLLSDRSSFSDMEPGDIVFLDDFASLREYFAPIFVAVLACPRYGSPTLITSVQYARGMPIVCSSRSCAGMFRIVDEAHIAPLLPN